MRHYVVSTHKKLPKFWKVKGSRGPTDLPTIYITDDSDTQNSKIRNDNFGGGGTHTQYVTNIHKNKIYCHSNSLNIKTVAESEEKIDKKGRIQSA